MAWTEPDSAALADIASALGRMADSTDSAKLREQRDYMGGQAAKARRLLVEAWTLLDKNNDEQDQFKKAQNYRALVGKIQQMANSIDLPIFED